jgi:hypothetical protein
LEKGEDLVYFVEVDIREGNRTITLPLHDPYTDNTLLHKGNVKFVLNAINDFRFEMLPTHPLYETELEPYLSWIRIKDIKGEIIFRGRVIDLSRKMTANGLPVKEYIAECELAYLLDSVQRVREFRGETDVTTGEFLRRLITRHNGRVEVEKRIHVVNVNGEDYDPALPESSFILEDHKPENGSLPPHDIKYGSTFENIKENLLGEFGGYLWMEYRGEDIVNPERVLCYWQDEKCIDCRENEKCEKCEAGEGVRESFWKKSEMPLRLAENLESIRSERLSSQAITRIVPLGIELNTPENAIRRLVAAKIINNEDIQDSRDYGPNVEWWKHNYSRIDPWMFQLLLNLSRLNYVQCDGEEVGCYFEGCNPDPPLRDLFDDATGRLDDHNNVRNAEAFGLAVDSLFLSSNSRPVRGIRNPDYWKARGRINMPNGDIQNIPDEDERIHLLRLRWLIRKAARDFTKCRPRLHQVDELNARLNLGNPTWIDVDMELALMRLEDAGIILTAAHWMDHYNNRFQLTLSPWTAQLLIALSALNYDRAKVIEARAAITGDNTPFDMLEHRRDELVEGIFRLARHGAILSPEYWIDGIIDYAIDIASLLWMAGQSVNERNPRSQFANSSRNLFGTTVEKVVIFEDVTDCNELWQKGITWIRNRVLSSSISVSALDLSHLDVAYDRFKVGYTYKADNHLLGINEEYRLIEQSVDITNPLKSSLTFGDRQMALSSTTSRAR